MDKARELGYNSVIVLGHENYYPKFGFLSANKWQIKAPFEVPENAFIGIELVADGLKNISGIFQWRRNKNVVLPLMRFETKVLLVMAEIFGGQGTINVPSWSPNSKHLTFLSYRLN